MGGLKEYLAIGYLRYLVLFCLRQDAKSTTLQAKYARNTVNFALKETSDYPDPGKFPHSSSRICMAKRP